MSKQTQPDFEPAVKAILVAFAAFTGFTMNKSIDALVEAMNLRLVPLEWTLKSFNLMLGSYQFWILLAVLSLLLRYIVGSAIHLNHVYVEKVAVEGDAPKRETILLEMPPGVKLENNGSLPIEIGEHKWDMPYPTSMLLVQKIDDWKRPRSKHLAYLFKDFVFLVIFGVLAVFIAKATDFSTLTFRSTLYLAAGLVWDLVDRLVRDGFKLGGTEESSKKVWGHGAGWSILDASQIVVTGIIAFGHHKALQMAHPHQSVDFWAAFVLALAYLVFLYLDLWILLVPRKSK